MKKKTVIVPSSNSLKHFKIRQSVREIFKRTELQNPQLHDLSSANQMEPGESPEWEITVLGTASMMPGKQRNVSGILVELPGGMLVLMDTGEGTFSQLKTKYGPYIGEVLQRIEMIVISHLHGDHFLGVFKVLEERQMELDKRGVKDKPCFLMLPQNSVSFFINYLADFRHLDLEVVCVNDLRKSPSHSVFKFKYEDNTTWKELKVNQDYVAEHDPNSYRGPQYKDFEMESAMVSLYERFPAGKTVRKLAKFLESREVCRFLMPRVVHCPDSFGVIVECSKGLKITYSGDCRPSKELIRAGRNSTVCIHEATFDDGPGMSKMARLKQHTTISEALHVSERMAARFTLLTHFSLRYNLFSSEDGEDSEEASDLGETQEHPLETRMRIDTSDQIVLDRFLRKSVLAVDFMSVNDQNLKWLPWINLVLNHSLIGDFSEHLKHLPVE